MPHLASPRPLPYQSHYDPQMHHGVVNVTGSLLVDLGLKHNNFDVQLCVQGAITDLAPALSLAWAYGPRKGTFIIQVGKATAAGTTTVIAATAAVNICFHAYAEASVAQ